MVEIITGFFQDIVSNDSTIAGQINTSGGLQLDIALLSKLVTPQGQHLQLPQLALDSVLAYIQKSTEQDVAVILYRAVQHANSIINQETSEIRGAACTLVIAAVQNRDTLFVANVGNSHAYLVRKEKVTQLTIEHTFAVMMPIQDKMSHSAAWASAEAKSLVLSIGPNTQIPADIGLHDAYTCDKESYLAAQTRGQAGLPLKSNDTIVLTTNRIETDGALAPSAILQALYNKIGDDAAESVAVMIAPSEAGSSIALIQLDEPELRLDPVAFEFLGRPAFLQSSAIAMVVVFFALVSFMGARYLEVLATLPQTEVIQAEENEVSFMDESPSPAEDATRSIDSPQPILAPAIESTPEGTRQNQSTPIQSQRNVTGKLQPIQKQIRLLVE